MMKVNSNQFIFLLYRFRRFQDDQVRKTNKLYFSEMRKRGDTDDSDDDDDGSQTTQIVQIFFLFSSNKM